MEQNLRVTESYNQTMIFYKEIKTKTLYFRKNALKFFFNRSRFEKKKLILIKIILKSKFFTQNAVNSKKSICIIELMY